METNTLYTIYVPEFGDSLWVTNYKEEGQLENDLLQYLDDKSAGYIFTCRMDDPEEAVNLFDARLWQATLKKYGIESELWPVKADR